jgi:hypothetical protein
MGHRAKGAGLMTCPVAGRRFHRGRAERGRYFQPNFHWGKWESAEVSIYACYIRLEKPKQRERDNVTMLTMLQHAWAGTQSHYQITAVESDSGFGYWIDCIIISCLLQ